MDDGLDAWIDRQTEASRMRMAAALSRTDLVHERVGFGFAVRPKPGSVLACPLSAHYDPDPDYFFHWFRDSATVMEALRIDAEDTGALTAARTAVSAFVRFNTDLSGIDGRTTALPPDVEPAFRRYLRPRTELDAVDGRTVVLEARVEADGRLDVTRWSRPQWDGPALRVLALSRWWDGADPDDRPAMRRLIASDLALLADGAAEESFDIWEEEFGRHLYNDLVIAAALAEGPTRLDDGPLAARCAAAAATVEARLPAYRADGGEWLRGRLPGRGISEEKALDIATVLGVLHAGRTEGPASLLDPAMHGTLARLEAHFAATYAINRTGPGAVAPAMGRYPGDVYVSGGAFYFSTFAAAEFHFRIAATIRTGARLEVIQANRGFVAGVLGRPASVAADGGCDEDPAALAAAFLARGDAFLATARAFAPADGALAEQFDRTDGRPASAKDLAWSHAAFLTAAAWRRRARESS
ncbi:glucoamylase [Amorphus suaedae]